MSVRTKRLLLWLVVMVIAAIVIVVTTSQPQATTIGPTATGPTPTLRPATPQPVAPLTAQLDALPATETTVPGYDRDAYGTGWKDPDHNGCDARNDTLARDLTAVTFAPGTHDCVVLTGTLDDPYSGARITFVRGNTTSDDVQIDHVVPLSWAWSHGAAGWTDEQRLLFANDPLNLRAVDGPTNGSKSDSGPAEWMPPATGYACTYVESFLAVLVAYDLGVDEADRTAMHSTLASC